MEAFGEPQYPTLAQPYRRALPLWHSRGTLDGPHVDSATPDRPSQQAQEEEQEEEDSRLCVCLCLRLRLGRAKPGQALACGQAVSTRGCYSRNPWYPGPQKFPRGHVVTCQASESTHFQPHGYTNADARKGGGGQRSRGFLRLRQISHRLAEWGGRGD